MRHQPEILEHHADPAAKSRQAVTRQHHRILAEQPDHATRRALREVQQLQQRGLAGATRTGEEIERTTAQGEADVRQRLRSGVRTRAVTKPDILELDDIRHDVVAPAFARLMPVPMPVSALSHESAGRFKLATSVGGVLIRHENGRAPAAAGEAYP